MRPSKDWRQLIHTVENDIKPVITRLEGISMANQQRVLDVFQRRKVADFHLRGTTGYGYNDQGRDILDSVYADIFEAESAIVRGQIASGTHAIALCLFGILRPGDKILSVNGAPYDTLQRVIGSAGNTKGSLLDWGVEYEEIALLPSGELDWEAIKHALNTSFKMIIVQRSRGYSLRKPIDIKRIGKIVNLVKEKQPETIVFVDNCYGEFVETREPNAVGVDIIAGSLIKNPGGGLAPTGGYVAGRKDLVEMAAARLTAPGIGGEVGATLGWQRMFFQGVFLAPSIVVQALKGAVFTSRLFDELGFDVSPLFNEPRTDIVQTITLESAGRLVTFCQAVQNSSPVDSYVHPEPGDMPGYVDPIIMAAGTFVQGGSLELTADGPLRPPYIAYFQGGLTFEHVKIAALNAALRVLESDHQTYKQS